MLEAEENRENVKLLSMFEGACHFYRPKSDTEPLGASV